MAFNGSLGEINYSALSGSKAETAVSIFVYDTKKDSDGGAWRKRTQHTSWYNETLNTATRGARKEFPSIAIIIAQETSLTIYDGDDPDLPMWMVFNRGADSAITNWWDGNNANKATKVVALNGILILSTTNAGCFGAEFISDKSLYFYGPNTNNGYRYNGQIINRNLSNISRVVSKVFNSTLVGYQNFDVTMTVLPDAPIDLETGLPTPTIGFGTEAGASIFRHDKTIVSGGEANASWSVVKIFFDNNYNLWGCEGTDYSPGIQLLSSPPYSSVASIGTGSLGYQLTTQVVTNYGQNTSWPFILGSYGYIRNRHAAGLNLIYTGSDSGITLLKDNVNDRSLSRVCYITSKYNTGWMPGNIKGAWLSDTTVENITGTELVTNGTFDTDTTGWADYNPGGANSATFQVVSGELQVVENGSANYGIVTQTFSVTAGVSYTVSVTFRTALGLARWWVGTSGGTADVVNVVDTTSTSNITTARTFTATSTRTLNISLAARLAEGATAYFDNVSIRRAELDRSVNNRGLQVFGTVTKSAVASGSNLVSYSGFSTSTYFQQPYDANSALHDGDFTISFWLYTSRPNDSSYGDIVSWGDIPYSTGYSTANRYIFFQLWGNTSGQPTKMGIYFKNSTSGAGALPFINIAKDAWQQSCLVRKSGILYWYINGKLVASGNGSGDFAAPSETEKYVWRVGWQGTGYDYPAQYEKIALLKMSKSSFDVKEIVEIYEQEKVLFQPNSQCTLYGSSNLITSVAYDNSLDRWYAGTSEGISTFSGLRRVSNTTTGVITEISASGGLIIDQ